MTKFEEELNKIVVEVQTPLDKYIVEKAASDESLYAQHYEAVLEKFKDRHSDEDYQRAKRMVEHVQVENEMLKAKLKSQLQQQALPVVPEFVDKWYKFHINGTFSAVITAYAKDGADKPVIWLGENGGMDLLCKMKLYGYQVEKPQLFYLKNKLTGLWLMRDEVDKVYPYDHTTYIGHRDKFAQQEIDSMQTGSYELVPVEDGE